MSVIAAILANETRCDFFGLRLSAVELAFYVYGHRAPLIRFERFTNADPVRRPKERASSRTNATLATFSLERGIVDGHHADLLTHDMPNERLLMARQVHRSRGV